MDQIQDKEVAGMVKKPRNQKKLEETRKRWKRKSRPQKPLDLVVEYEAEIIALAVEDVGKAIDLLNEHHLNFKNLGSIDKLLISTKE